MDYNLCKELKEAGFPNSNQWLDGSNGFWVDMGEFSYAVPTLEELIEACDGFGGLLKGTDGTFTAFQGLLHQFGIATNGSTASEAVARLWLAINKK